MQAQREISHEEQWAAHCAKHAWLTKLYIAGHRAEIAKTLREDQRLFNARHHRDFFCMAVFYGQEIDRNVAMTPEQVREIFDAQEMSDATQ